MFCLIGWLGGQSQLFVYASLVLIVVIELLSFFSKREKEARLHGPEGGLLEDVWHAGHLIVVHYGTPRAVLVRKAERCVAHQHTPRVHVFQMEHVLARDQLASLLRGPKRALCVAEQLPVVAKVPLSVISESGDFLALAEWSSEGQVGVQVFAGRVVLKPNLRAATQRLASLARLVQTVCLAHGPQRLRIIFVLT